jgi:hypothetical protein
VRIAASLAAGILLALPPAAGARDRDIPRDGPLVVPAEMPDRTIDRAPARIASARPAGRLLRAPDGQRVEVAVSSAYGRDAAADQAYVDFLGSRLHGRELGQLRLYVGTPEEIESLCGGEGAVACYAIEEQRIYVPGEETYGVPVGYALTHEYGHHVANWRLNTPWEAVDWGPKHWSSAVHVCRHVESGALWPGDQGRHYLDDPGEGFADGYAQLHYPAGRWRYNPLMRPTAAVARALRRDVLRPWRGPRSRTFRGRLGPRRAKQSFTVPVRLDGDVVLDFRGPRGATYEVEGRAESWAVGRTMRRRDGFGIEWCRYDARDVLTFTVRRRRGAGPFTLRVRYPG